MAQEVAEMRFALKLQELMLKAGMKDEEGKPDPARLGKASGVPLNTLRGYVFGSRANPSGRYLLLIARALKVPSDTFMDCLDDLGIKKPKKKRK